MSSVCSRDVMYIIKTPVCLAKNRLLVYNKCILRKLIHIFLDILETKCKLCIFIKILLLFFLNYNYNI